MRVRHKAHSEFATAVDRQAMVFDLRSLPAVAHVRHNAPTDRCNRAIVSHEKTLKVLKIDIHIRSEYRDRVWHLERFQPMISAFDVAATDLPAESRLHNRVAPGDFLDCYVVSSDLSPRRAANIITELPGWARLLLHVRRVLTAPFRTYERWARCEGQGRNFSGRI